jgi:hypothetical protein
VRGLETQVAITPEGDTQMLIAPVPTTPIPPPATPVVDLSPPWPAESMFLHEPPDKAALIKARMNIKPDYFVTPIEDPSPRRLDEIRKELQSLLSQG